MLREAMGRRVGGGGRPRVVVASGMAGTGVSLVGATLQDALPAAEVVDAGARWADIAEACTPGFTRMLVVTTHDVVAITAAYALVKLVRDRHPDAALELLVNRSTEREALRTYERVQGAASHFLNETVAYAGAIPDGDAMADAGAPSMTHTGPGGMTAVTAALRALAARLDEELDAMAGTSAPGAPERRRYNP